MILTLYPKKQTFRDFFLSSFPLLSEINVNEDDGSWWLLDSGASTTMMSSRFLSLYHATSEETYVSAMYRAANGTPVEMHGQTEVFAWVMLCDSKGNARYKRAKLRALVADIRNNIISTTTLCASGWQFWQSPTQCQVIDESSQEYVGDVASFAGCPWIRLYPDKMPDTHKHVQRASMSQCERSSSKSVRFAEGHLQPLTRASEQALEKHRLQGHAPFDPRCTICDAGMVTL